MMRTTWPKNGFAVAILTVLVFGAADPAAAQTAPQIVIWDQVLTITAPWTQGDPLPATPKNFTAPVDYLAGKVHLHLEVLTKASEKPFFYRFQFYPGNFATNNPNHYWTDPLEGPVTQTGVFDKEYAMATLGHGGGDWADWTQAVAKLQYSTYDQGNQGVPEGNAEIYPYKIHIVVTLLPKGSVYMRPNIYGGLDFDTLKAVPSVLAQVKQGAFGQALKAAEKAKASKTAGVSEEADRAIAALQKHAADQRAEAEGLKAKEPLAAYAQLNELAKQFEGSDLGKELAALRKTWTDDPVLAKELQAAKLYDKIQALYAAAQKKGDPRDPVMARRSADELAGILAAARTLKKSYPGTQACQQAEALCARLKLPL